MNDLPIEKRKFIKACPEGFNCDGCKKHVKGGDNVLRYCEKQESGKYKILLLGICCAWKYPN